MRGAQDKGGGGLATELDSVMGSRGYGVVAEIEAKGY